VTKITKYKITEKDIDSVLNFLKINDPEHATPDMAIALLEYFQATFHAMRHENLDQLTEIYEEFKKYKN
jgi:hypothetical protein